MEIELPVPLIRPDEDLPPMEVVGYHAGTPFFRSKWCIAHVEEVPNQSTKRYFPYQFGYFQPAATSGIVLFFTAAGVMFALREVKGWALVEDILQGPWPFHGKEGLWREGFLRKDWRR